MTGTQDDRRTPEPPDERALRIAWLRDEIASGGYWVPAAAVARGMIRRLGIDLLRLQHQ